METRQAYLLRRAAEERSAADQASGEAARKAHLDLERRYRDMAQSNALGEAESTPTA